ncbi:hypothetical protein GYMLUDRAFT_87354 [Collybiopsis luxurians FD-317 M1]|uniref:Unplaced genomic scaffold GYMLUscaffold_51, whole genome shotgun sequence n=1 Tax=Collybiopsis luxurians FD-317 M1 TaxID=944289 RepID=A0A0D0AZU9_9AGAR|nr:hypothetical protein GYMLUDRAFT_87354 [Collybiopsis luxurians FD-317 M1]
MSGQIFKLNPTVEGLQSLRVAKKCLNHPLREFADLILKVLQCYDEDSPLGIRHLIKAVYEFGVAKIKCNAKTDPRELDRLKGALSNITSKKDASDAYLQNELFEQELIRVENSSSTISVSRAPHDKSPTNLYQYCNFHHAERDMYTSKINDQSAKYNCYNRSNHGLNTDTTPKGARRPQRGRRPNRAKRANKIHDELRTSTRSPHFGSKFRHRGEKSKLARGYLRGRQEAERNIDQL